MFKHIFKCFSINVKRIVSLQKNIIVMDTSDTRHTQLYYFKNEKKKSLHTEISLCLTCLMIVEWFWTGYTQLKNSISCIQISNSLCKNDERYVKIWQKCFKNLCLWCDVEWTKREFYVMLCVFMIMQDKKTFVYNVILIWNEELPQESFWLTRNFFTIWPVIKRGT